MNATKIHIARKSLIYYFHVMNAWNENLLIRIPEPDKEELWHSLHVLMQCPNESHFEVHLQKLYNIPTVNVYI